MQHYYAKEYKIIVTLLTTETDQRNVTNILLRIVCLHQKRQTAYVSSDLAFFLAYTILCLNLLLINEPQHIVCL